MYRGGIEGAESLFWLDDHHAFEKGRTERICANTAAMLSATRFARWFEIRGSRNTHFGVFPCGPTLARVQHGNTLADGEGSCC
jgi:hypothetical protein